MVDTSEDCGRKFEPFLAAFRADRESVGTWSGVVPISTVKCAAVRGGLRGMIFMQEKGRASFCRLARSLRRAKPAVKGLSKL